MANWDAAATSESLQIADVCLNRLRTKFAEVCENEFIFKQNLNSDDAIQLLVQAKSLSDINDTTIPEQLNSAKQAILDAIDRFTGYDH